MKPCYKCGGQASPEYYEHVVDEGRKSDYPKRLLSSERWYCRACRAERDARALVVTIPDREGWDRMVAERDERRRRAREQLF